MREPDWITRAICDAIHSDQIRQHGGRSGIRDENVIESALARPRNKFAYDSTCDIRVLAAAYTYALSRNHGYVDGNKRVAVMVMYTFLGLSGVRLRATEPEVVRAVVKIASGTMSESALITWLEAHTVSRSR